MDPSFDVKNESLQMASSPLQDVWKANYVSHSFKKNKWHNIPDDEVYDMCIQDVLKTCDIINPSWQTRQTSLFPFRNIFGGVLNLFHWKVAI